MEIGVTPPGGENEGPGAVVRAEGDTEGMGGTVIGGGVLGVRSSSGISGKGPRGSLAVDWMLDTEARELGMAALVASASWAPEVRPGPSVARGEAAGGSTVGLVPEWRFDGFGGGAGATAGGFGTAIRPLGEPPEGGGPGWVRATARFGTEGVSTRSCFTALAARDATVDTARAGGLRARV
jgi:hypothetical protein